MDAHAVIFLLKMETAMTTENIFAAKTKKTSNCLASSNNFGNYYLTKRETEVLKYIVMGCTSKQIGKLLGISFRTIETYIEILKVKFNCKRKGDIVRIIMEDRLIFQLGIF